MKKKVILIFLSSFSVQLIIACCNCPEPIIYLYKFEYMSAFNLDNSGANPVISESPIPKSAYGIKLQLGLRQLSQHDRNHFSLFNQAHSAECFCGPDTTIFPRDTITSLTITTATRFSDNHQRVVTSPSYLRYYGGKYMLILTVSPPDLLFTTPEPKQNPWNYTFLHRRAKLGITVSKLT
jgi:hypothetical protein